MSDRTFEIERLDAAQVRSARLDQVASSRVVKQTRADGAERFCLEAVVTRASQIELPDGGFDRLHVRG